MTIEYPEILDAVNLFPLKSRIKFLGNSKQIIERKREQLKQNFLPKRIYDCFLKPKS